MLPANSPASDALLALLARGEQLLTRVETLLARELAAPDWSASTAFRFASHARGVSLLPVKRLASISLADLQDVSTQKERLVQNTRQFVAGKPANNVLLTGARGTGKSSLVRACLHEFAAQGLRLIEMDKTELLHLPELVELVAERPERFIIFSDDLSFDEGEKGYKALKSVLDGGISSGGDNVLIYATSNRRHLLPEYMRENDTYQHQADGEIHPGEGVEEKISLSERFGLWLSFYPFSQDEYLRIVQYWISSFNIPTADHCHSMLTIKSEALVFALERGSDVVVTGCDVWMIGWEHSQLNLECLQLILERLVVITFALERDPNVVVTLCDVWVIGW